GPKRSVIRKWRRRRSKRPLGHTREEAPNGQRRPAETLVITIKRRIDFDEVETGNLRQGAGLLYARQNLRTAEPGRVGGAHGWNVGRAHHVGIDRDVDLAAAIREPSCFLQEDVNENIAYLVSPPDDTAPIQHIARVFVADGRRLRPQANIITS